VLVRLFKTRFDPETKGRDRAFPKALEQAVRVVEGYNTGHRHLDELRRVIFHTCLCFIRHTLKTNFFVLEKHAPPCHADRSSER